MAMKTVVDTLGWSVAESTTFPTMSYMYIAINRIPF